jgi:hypothetical protein
MWQSLISPIANLAGGYMKNKAEEKQAKHKAKMTMIENDADWEAKMAEASKDSWKDEYLVICLTAPIVFIGYAVGVDDPTIIARVEEGFAALSRLPEWYQYLLFIAVSSSFGIKGADKLMSLRKK